MRTQIYIILISTLLAFNTKGQNIKTISERSFGYNEIAASSEKEYKRKLKKIKSYPEHFDLYFVSKTSLEFDDRGNLISEIEYLENGQLYSRATYVYTVFNKILQKNYDYQSNSRSNQAVAYSYNIDEKLIQVIDSSSSYVKQTDISYPRSNLTQSTLRINGKYIDKWLTESDTLINFELTTALDNNDSVYVEIKRWFNEHHRLIKQIDLDSNHEPSLTRFYEYDNDGNKIYEKEVIHYDSVTIERYWITDSVNNSKDSKFFRNEKLDHFSRTYYDTNGNEIKTEFYDTEKLDSLRFTTSSEYKYDEHGTWIEKKDFSKREIQSITYREIEYFK